MTSPSASQTREGLTDKNSVFEEVTNGFEDITLGTGKVCMRAHRAAPHACAQHGAHTPLSPQVASRAYVSWFGFKGGDQQKKVAYMLGQ